MLPDGQPRHEPTRPTVLLRHRRVPARAFGHKVIVARPRDGAPVVLASTAAFVWREIADWSTPQAVDLRLAAAFPDVPERERLAALGEIIRALQDDDLLEPG